MAEANGSICDSLERARAYDAPATIMRLALFAAKKAVKQDIRDRGEKLVYIDQSDILTAAHQYLGEHPELVEEAAETVRLVPQLRTLAEREARERRRKQR